MRLWARAGNLRWRNALYDVTFTLEKFSNLDGSYEGFKSALNDAILGAFYDTKHLARAFADRWFVDAPRADAEETSAAPSLDTALGPLYENLSTRRVPKSREGTHANEVANEVANVVANEVANEVANDAATILDVIDFPDGFDRYAAALRRRDADDADAVAALAKERASFAHEAGYDAYMTGVCFLTMALYGRVAANSDGVGSTRVPPADSRDGDGDTRPRPRPVVFHRSARRRAVRGRGRDHPAAALGHVARASARRRPDSGPLARGVPRRARAEDERGRVGEAVSGRGAREPVARLVDAPKRRARRSARRSTIARGTTRRTFSTRGLSSGRYARGD